VVGGRFLQSKPYEPAKRHPIVESLFEVGVGQSIPLLQQQGLQHHQRLLARTAGTIRSEPRHQLLQPIPLHFRRKPFKRRVLAEFR
jgi:hypothetical protein